MASRLNSVRTNLGAKLRRAFHGLYGRETIEAYWYKGKRNFGDLLTPFILHSLGYAPVHAQPDHATLVSTGSILEHVPTSYGGTILGSGFIEDGDQVNFRNARILGVRGHLTRKRLGIEKGIVLGDPGLLVRDLINSRECKKFELGIIPHYAQKFNPEFRLLRERMRGKVKFIDPQNDPLTVINLIDQCENILSSSLHGLIVSDALSISNAWLSPDKLLGGCFKFQDYFSSIKFQAEPVKISGTESLEFLIALCGLKNREAIDSVILGLKDAWRGLGIAVK